MIEEEQEIQGSFVKKSTVTEVEKEKILLKLQLLIFLKI
ncbi:hypothetical protein RCA_03190 [Rickettsia canadensis str. CA410]|uniref:Uncharacterized protein n=1 Tax=Rickettsia canadensis str. CA410 TaxID=1105107 RepID=A0ABM5MRR1_RICCA|nr:hypothetical protein RCA_03190 [Rickettsia canadensis str. CA410]